MITLKDNFNTFRGRKILVVGLARSGTGAANILSMFGARVTVTDSKSRKSLQGRIKRLLPEVEVVAGGNPGDIFEDADMIVVSPGVPSDIPPLLHAKRKGVPVIAELELAYRLTGTSVPEDERLFESRPSFIGVTGTNGKSTTATLINLILKESGYRTIIGGNIGNALTEEILKEVKNQGPGVGSRKIDYIVAEISSFQLETVDRFRPDTAVLLNITPDHLDRYAGVRDYIEAKAGIFKRQERRDLLVLNADDPLVMELYDTKIRRRGDRAPGVFFFSREKEVEGIYSQGDLIYCNLPGLRTGLKLPLATRNEIKIKGVHNIENAMAASLAALVSGCSCQAVRDVLKTFPGLEHRLEPVEEIRGVRFINDSKGTNVGAVAKSLEGFDNVILIMGGTDKNSDFSVLNDPVRRKVKSLILIGEAKGKIAAALGTAAETCEAGSLEEAVTLSMSKAVPGDVVMLSPGCASFDMFSGFEERGRTFKGAVRKLLKEKS